MLQMRPYEGPFSFVSSKLHSDVRTILPDYDEHDPKTWPYVTMAAVEKHGQYWSYPDLPAGIAYERSVMKRYEYMYSAADRKHIASVNGSFHARYPCNYDQHDKPKSQVGMAEAEYNDYMAAVAKETPAATPTLKLRRPQRKKKCDSKQNKSHDTRRYANKKYLGTRREAARLQGELLRSSQQHIREFERMERYRRSVTSQMELELERQTQRAEAAERECQFRKEENIRLTMRVRELEKRVLRGHVRSALQPFEG